MIRVSFTPATDEGSVALLTRNGSGLGVPIATRQSRHCANQGLLFSNSSSGRGDARNKIRLGDKGSFFFRACMEPRTTHCGALGSGWALACPETYKQKCSVPELIRCLFSGAALGLVPTTPKRVCVSFVAPPHYPCIENEALVAAEKITDSTRRGFAGVVRFFYEMLDTLDIGRRSEVNAA